MLVLHKKPLILSFYCILLLNCTSPKPQAKHQYIVKSEPIRKVLYFSGYVQPIKESSLTSPADATIESLSYHYGEVVKESETVAVLNSTKLQNQYNETLTEYLKSKDSYNIIKAKFRGTKNLWDLGLISKNTFLSERSSLDTAHISYLQASHKLTEILKKLDEVPEDIAKLSLAKFEKVRAALTENHHVISLKASSTGVLLYPPKGSEDKSLRYTVGSIIKEGEVFAVIGDLTGIRVLIDIPEIEIIKLHQGMQAKLSSVALGQTSLKGTLVRINEQASNAGSGLPFFSAEVEVKNLSQEERQKIKIGMSLNVELETSSEPQIVIPIKAVQHKNSKILVKVKESSGKLHSQAILTGLALLDKVVVKQGLKPGDVIVYD